MISRRAFVVGSLTLLTGPLTAEAQQARKVPTIGVLSPWGASMAAWSQREPFEHGLRDLGWTPGANIVIEQRYAEGKSERWLGLATDLVQMKVDVIVAHGPAAIRAARQATSRIPIVMAGAGDAISEGHVPSLARPGGNVTGLSLFVEGRRHPGSLECAGPPGHRRRNQRRRRAPGPAISLSSNQRNSSSSSTSRPRRPSASRSRRRCSCGRIR